MSTPVTSSRDFIREIVHEAPNERIFDALATLDGLAGWWTPIVRGTPTTDGEIECLTHTGHREWQGTTIIFELTKDQHQSGVLKFRHVGLSPTLNCYETCESGWDHFLTSLLDYAEHGEGNPF
jgi:hypothetical protein